MRVNEARPEKGKRKLENEDTEDAEGSATIKARKEKKKPKREEGVLPGVELPKERKVKRGWTEPEAPSKSKKSSRVTKEKGEKKPKAKPSSFTNEPELLFKTTIPPNATPLQDEVSSTKNKVKKRKRGETDREVLVHEFSNTTKQPVFLRDSQAVNGKKGASEYVEGQGWVDEAGNIIDPEHKPGRTRSKAMKEQPQKVEGAKNGKPRIEPKVNIPTIGLTKTTNTSPKLLNDDETSSSGSSLDSASEAESEAPKKTTSHPPQKASSPPSASSDSDEAASSRVNRLSITRSSATPPPTTTSPPPPSAPHPLETIFKRPRAAASATPRKPNLEVTTSFSFFDPDVDEAPLTGVGLLAPQTPFTRRDLNERGQRSAAPTPDTAMPGRSFWGADREGSLGDDGDVSGPEGMEGYSLPILGEEEEEEEPTDDVQDGERGGKKKVEAREKEEKEESAFAKEFWEKRGERNRAVKRRVREAKKEKRRSENKRRGGRL